MYVEVVPNRNSPPAILLREAFREEGRVRKRTLANLSKWPPEKVEALRLVLGGGAVASLTTQGRSAIDEDGIKQRFEVIRDHLDERGRRLVAGAEVKVLGEGGVSAVSRATGVSRQAIRRGIEELDAPVQRSPGPRRARIRRPGAGRKRTVDTDPTLLADLEKLVEPVTRGDPESPLRWTCKSIRRLAGELKQAGHRVSHRLVGESLRELGYSLQANRKTREGSDHPDRNAQFEFINARAQECLGSGQPVISVDTKKKELVGEFKNGGREWRPKGQPDEVRVHDFIIPELGRAIPYGVYDVGSNTGWVSVGTDHDTSAFAVETIRRWWLSRGSRRYPQARKLLITADGGGSNGSRVRLWKVELQRLADELSMPISVSHLPPGTSKWNKIEHRLFSFITQNWRGKPLVSHEVIVRLIAATTTEAGLSVHAELDTNEYPTQVKVSDRDLEALNLHREEFHGEWNYTLHPR